jgi:hypothetical protein
LFNSQVPCSDSDEPGHLGIQQSDRKLTEPARYKEPLSKEEFSQAGGRRISLTMVKI